MRKLLQIDTKSTLPRELDMLGWSSNCQNKNCFLQLRTMQECQFLWYACQKRFLCVPHASQNFYSSNRSEICRQSCLVFQKILVFQHFCKWNHTNIALLDFVEGRCCLVCRSSYERFDKNVCGFHQGKNHSHLVLYPMPFDQT